METDRLQEIEARLNAATPGPWYVPLYGFTVDTNERHLLCMVGASVSEQVNSDMRFIAASREDIPYLLDKVKELKKQLQETRDCEVEFHRAYSEWLEEAQNQTARAEQAERERDELMAMMPHECETCEYALSDDERCGQCEDNPDLMYGKTQDVWKLRGEKGAGQAQKEDKS